MAERFGNGTSSTDWQKHSLIIKASACCCTCLLLIYSPVYYHLTAWLLAEYYSTVTVPKWQPICPHQAFLSSHHRCGGMLM